MRSSICKSLSRSPCISLLTGMPVDRDTTSAISSAPTSFLSSLNSRLPSPAASACFIWASRAGSLPYWISATLSNRPFLCRSAISPRSRSISSLMWAAPCTTAFSAFQTSSRSEYSFSSLRISSSSMDRRFLDASSFSFFTASRSILSWISRRSSLSMDSGLESISILMRAAASSIRSMALSGRKRSVM